MANRGIDMAEAERLLQDPAIVEVLQAQGDLPRTTHAVQEAIMPGIASTFLQSGGGCDPTQQVCGPGGTFIPVPGNRQLPGGIVTDWPGLIRQGIDLIFGGGGGGGITTLQGGVPETLPRFPNTGPFTGPLLPTITGGRAPFITMPNGLPGCPSGYHPEKSGKAYCVRNRRMNPLNPRALSRATRRVGGFARAVKRARTIKKVCRSL